MSFHQQLSYFPSRENERQLRQHFRPSGGDAIGSVNNLTDDERWQWHAYVYGMRRAMLNCRDVTSPIDPLGEWFNAELADAAEAYYCGRHK